MLQHLFLSLALTLGQTNAPPPPAETAPAAATPAAADAPADAAPAAPETWFLMKSLQGSCAGDFLDCHKIQISGWTDASFTASSAAHNQLPMGFNYEANQFLLQQNWLRVERAVDTTSKCDPSYGFRVDTILPGSDYRFTAARGLWDGQLTAHNGGPDTYGIDPIQFYAEAYFPQIGAGLDVKFGRFFAQYGVESNDAPSNALLSHAYTFIYDPFTQTGILGTLKLDEDWSVQSGLVLGSDVFIDPADDATYIGSVKWAPPKGKDSVLFSVIVGSGRYNQAQNFHNPDVFDLVYTHKFNDKLNYTFESLYGFTNDVPAIGFANWFGIVDYLTYAFNPKVSGTARMEFFDDAQGQRTGHEGLYTDLTAGLAFKPHRAVTIRPEIRYDNNGYSRPFENEHGLFTASSDIIVRW